MATVTEEIIKGLTETGDLVKEEADMKERVESMKREREVLSMEMKQLTNKNEDMKNQFAVLLDKFQDFVNSAEQSQGQMRATIKRLSVENQRLKVNYHLEARDIRESQSQQEQLEEAHSQLSAMAQENVNLKKKVQALQDLKP